MSEAHRIFAPPAFSSSRSGARDARLCLPSVERRPVAPPPCPAVLKRGRGAPIARRRAGAASRSAQRHQYQPRTTPLAAASVAHWFPTIGSSRTTSHCGSPPFLHSRRSATHSMRLRRAGSVRWRPHAYNLPLAQLPWQGHGRRSLLFVFRGQPSCLKSSPSIPAPDSFRHTLRPNASRRSASSTRSHHWHSSEKTWL